jgi:ABC-type phosphate transport system substrate-binding protein
MALVLTVVLGLIGGGGAALAGSQGPRDPDRGRGPADDPVVTVDPTADLIEGQFLDVAWSGFRANAYVYVRQCAPTIAVDTDCTAWTAVVSDTNGAGSTLYEVLVGALTDTLTCDYQHACRIGVFQSASLDSTSAFADISFLFPPEACPAPTGQTITGTGSAAANTALFRWRGAICTSPTSLSVNYVHSNSPSGKNDFVGGLTDYAVTGDPFSQEQLDDLESQNRTFAYAPITASGLVFGFNIHNRLTKRQITDLELTPALVAEIFTAQLRNWTVDPDLIALNPDAVNWSPNVKPVGAAYNSYGTLLLTSWLWDTAQEAYTAGGPQFEGGPTDTFPATVAVDLRSTAEAVARQVAKPDTDTDLLSFGYIGWMDSSYARLYGLPTAQIQNAAGEFVTATPESVTAALAAATVNPDGVTRSPDFTEADPTIYPLPVVSYVVAPTSVFEGDFNDFTKEKGDVLRGLLTYAAGDGQANLAPGYTTLPADLADLTEQAIEDIPSTSEPDPTPSKTPPPTTPPPTTFPPATTPSYTSGSGNGATPTPSPTTTPLACPSGTIPATPSPSPSPSSSGPPSPSPSQSPKASPSPSPSQSPKPSPSPTPSCSPAPASPSEDPFAPVGQLSTPATQLVLPTLIVLAVLALGAGPFLQWRDRVKSKPPKAKKGMTPETLGAEPEGSPDPGSAAPPDAPAPEPT